ncbi:dTMP kinase [Schaalia sp. ZJ1691]|uniref:dTMP kinase n=1 Tax=Schaalia sp. ZJ1691 TaxID=2709404 RepID=UPI0013EC1A25|nr:dTMP kinase [Schaalia sp. ZJ1691]
MTASGVFITFEGGDGSGKSTQIQRARTWFEERNFAVIVTREPGGTDLGTHLRQLVQNGPEDIDPRTEALLYAADRAYHVSTVIRPALARGVIVLADRYIDSSLAYQGAARELGTEEIRALSAWATQDLKPHLTFLIDLPPEVGARRNTDAPDRMERESTDFHEAVRHEYLRLADAEPERIVVIDGVGTPDEVFSEIRGVLNERFPEDSSAEDTESVEPGHQQPGEEKAKHTQQTVESPADRKDIRSRTEQRKRRSSQAPTMVGFLDGGAQATLWEPAEDGTLI